MSKYIKFMFFKPEAGDPDDNVRVMPMSIRDKCEHAFREKNGPKSGWPLVCRKCGQAARANGITHKLKSH